MIERVCEPKDEHRKPSETTDSLTVSAPEGFLITGYCVKAGSVTTGDGPEITWDYQGLILRFESRALDNLHLLASWVISESKGSINFNSGATGAFDGLINIRQIA